ncbi:TonB-dependent receptor [Novosphingobium sp. JCM 18896]|uniref:TonB-dependent receptor n=1 Tax=Novosphingobium sp. JCM 18896 TaxID=2989731 RepID=UPI0022223D6D|nr:TonB-dependent receptor [Novosphingobium sp. JCM 18896]MCW1428360.1 TonB-dependent receptor [Novosphingobium sp. JCM 18896]
MKSHTNMRSRLLLSTTLAAIAAIPAQAWAQSETTGLEDIVVTAQKREQVAQDVPIALTALSADTIQANRVVSVNDLTGLAPGLLSRQNAGALGSPSFSMRGVFASASAPSQDRQISVYLDGVYIGGTRGSVFDLPDTQRIEVLRGPQGTLFGRNATAGAISVVTRDPKGELAWRQEVTVGNYDQLRVRTTIDTPQIGPFSAFFTYVHDERRGDVRNLGAGTTFDYTSPFTNQQLKRSPEWLGGRNFENFFAAVKFEPSDTFSATYKFDSTSGDVYPEARAPVAINGASFTGNMLAQILAAQPAGGGRFGPVVLNPGNQRPDATNNAWSQVGFQKSSGHNLTINLQLTDDLSFKNITAYRKSEVWGPSTIAGLSGLEFTAGSVVPYATFAGISALSGAGVNVANPANAALVQATIANIAAQLGPAVAGRPYFAGYEGNSYGKGHQWSNEAQLNYRSDFADLTVGALWYHSKELNSGLPGMAPNFAFAITPQLLPLGNVQDGTSIATSLAAYIQGEFHLSDKFDIVAGGRITRDKKRGDLVRGGVFSGSRTGTGEIVSGTGTGALTSFPFNFEKTKPTFSVGLNYKPNDDVLAYAKISSAFLSGGAVGQISFEPETVLSQEVGLKSEWLDRRLRVNLALWHAKYKNVQSAQSGSVVTFNGVNQAALGVVVISNGEVNAKGFELEVNAAPADGLTFGGSVGYTDANLKNPSPLVAQGRPYKLTGVAPWIASLNGQYVTPPLFDDATMFFRLDATYQGKYRTIPFTDVASVTPAFAPYEFTEARWILNGRVALRDFNVGPAKGEIGLWGRNLTNNRSAQYFLQFGDFEANASYQQARTWGVDFILDF